MRSPGVLVLATLVLIGAASVFRDAGRTSGPGRAAVGSPGRGAESEHDHLEHRGRTTRDTRGAARSGSEASTTLLRTEADDLGAKLPRLPALEPEAALRALRVEPGFRVELAACEPDVVDPVALAFDEDGRLYVAEDRDYPWGMRPEEPALGRVRRLEDRDGDGRFETSVVFADAVHWPTGLACWQGGVYVAAPPRILYLKDTDGDGRADVRRTVFDGFGTEAAEDVMNNLQWGLDHRIYGASSYNGGDVRRGDDPQRPPVSVRGRDFRFDPRTERLEPLAGTGDFGNAFDDWGRRFVSNAGMLLYHCVLPGEYLARNPHLATKTVLHRAAAAKREMFQISPPEPWRAVRKEFWSRWVDTTPDMRAARFSERELALAGFVTGGAGACVFRGDALPDEYRGHSFTAEPAGNVVIRLRLVPNGATFDALPTSPEREFLASTDNWFRPVNVANGPDGALWVLDMAREVIEDPSAIPDDILQRLDVTSGRDRGRLWRIVPESFRLRPTPRLSRATSDELVGLLAHPNAWHRETARRLLWERNDPRVVGPLIETAQSASVPLARLEAACTLDGLGRLDDRTRRLLLSDAHAGLREHGARLSESRLRDAPGLRRQVLALADDPEPRVRLHVAFALGEMPDDDETVAALAAIAVRDADDPWIPIAVLSSSGTCAGRLFRAVRAAPGFVPSVATTRFLASLASLVGSSRDDREATVVLTDVAASSAAAGLRDSVARREASAILRELATGLARAGGSFAALHDRQPVPARNELVALFDEALQDVSRAERTTEDRIAAAGLLRFDPRAGTPPVLAALVVPREPVALQSAAMQALAARSDDDVADLLIERWRSVGPDVQPELIESLFRRTERLPKLLDAVQSGRLSRADLDPVRQAALRAHSDPTIRRRAASLLPDEPTRTRAEVLHRFREVPRLAADGTRGRDVFRKRCATCHRLEGVGHVVGPDLAGVRQRSAEQLLIAILDPNRELKPQYANYVVVTEDGRSFTGMIGSETAQSIVLRRPGGAEDVVLRSAIEELRSTRLSVMPEGLEKDLDAQQLADVVAYLRGAAAPPAAAAP